MYTSLLGKIVSAPSHTAPPAPGGNDPSDLPGAVWEPGNIGSPYCIDCTLTRHDRLDAQWRWFSKGPWVENCGLDGMKSNRKGRRSGDGAVGSNKHTQKSIIQTLKGLAGRLGKVKLSTNDVALHLAGHLGKSSIKQYFGSLGCFKWGRRTWRKRSFPEAGSQTGSCFGTHLLETPFRCWHWNCINRQNLLPKVIGI